MSKPTKRSYATLAAFMMLVAVGCGGGGPAVQAVTGKITVDGEPVAGVGVSLIAASGEGMGLMGTTDASGAFSIVAAGGYEGAPVGSYKVVLTAPQPEADYDAGVVPETVEFPPRYSNIESAEIPTFEVTSGSNVITIDVTTK